MDAGAGEAGLAYSCASIPALKVLIPLSPQSERLTLPDRLTWKPPPRVEPGRAPIRLQRPHRTGEVIHSGRSAACMELNDANGPAHGDVLDRQPVPRGG